MKRIKTKNESQPVAEALDNEKIVFAQQDGTITVVYLNSDKILSIKINAEAIQIESNSYSIYVSTKPFVINTEPGKEESEEVHANNLLAIKKTGSTLWKIDILEDSLLIHSSLEMAGGFAIHGNKIYACNITTYGFYVLSLDLVEIEKVFVQLEPSTRRPWYSHIEIFDDVLFLIQEEERIRWFKLGGEINEMGIIEPEFIHRTPFISVNSRPEKILRIGAHLLGIIESDTPYVICIDNNKPSVAIDPTTVFDLMYNENSLVMNRVQAVTDQLVLGIDRYRIIVANQEMNTLLHTFCLDEADEGLNNSRITANGRYAVCFAWTYSKKYPLIVLDLSVPTEPSIIKVIDCGIVSDVISIEVDE